jgi:Domain of Unknown Function (DUF1080)
MFPRILRIAIIVAAFISVRIARGADNELTAQEKADGWILLFDGKTGDGWIKDKTDQPVPAQAIEDGAINAHKVGDKSYVPYYAKRQFGDFVLALDFKLSKGCNSGVFFRVTNPKDPVQSGFEIQLLDSAGKAKVEKHDCGALYDALEPSKNAAKPAGEWQHMEITARGNLIQVVLNGEKVVEANLDQWTQAGKNPDGTKNKYKTAYKDMAKSGYVGIQDHNSDVWFKNIKIKPLQ